MNEALNFYHQQAERRTSTIPWLAALQKDALADLQRIGFPGRHDEAWKYTVLDSFYKQGFATADNACAHSPSPAVDVPADLVVYVINGVVTGLEEIASQLPKGMIVMPLTEALKAHPETVQAHLSQMLPHEHGFQALNTAMMQSGLFVYMPKNARLDKTLLIAHLQDNAQQAVYLRHLVVAEEGSSVRLIEDYHGEETCEYFTNAMTQVHAAQNAAVSHYKIQRESSKAYHISHLAVTQAQSSQVNSHSFSIGAKIARCDVTMTLNEPHTRTLLNGVYAPREGQHVDHHTLVEHNVPDCYSEQDYKGILSGRSRAVFNGIVKVAKHAQQTIAKQQNKNVLLSKNAEVDTKPQLEIFADDVVCTHGATVGQLDEEALFYLATRGIDRSLATRYLIQAFAADNLKAVDDPKLSAWMSQRLNQLIG